MHKEQEDVASYYLAPYQCELMKWLREKHNINISIFYNRDYIDFWDYDNEDAWAYYIENNGPPLKSYGCTKPISTLELALRAVLKLI